MIHLFSTSFSHGSNLSNLVRILFKLRDKLSHTASPRHGSGGISPVAAYRSEQPGAVCQGCTAPPLLRWLALDWRHRLFYFPAAQRGYILQSRILSMTGKGREIGLNIRLDFLEQVVLYEVNRLAAFANEYEHDFVKTMLGRSAKVAENDRARKQRELNAPLTRDKELDMLFERLYEDNMEGKIDDARFARMSKRYEQEQGEISAKIKALRLELKKAEGQQMDMEDYLQMVRRYTHVTKITQRMVSELIGHIDVYHAEKQDGVTNQRVDIHYNCIGAFDVPDRRKIPEADIIMETRKGVALSYAPEQVAV